MEYEAKIFSTTYSLDSIGWRGLALTNARPIDEANKWVSDMVKEGWYLFSFDVKAINLISVVMQREN